jgi:SAM-dependent methyltransferase
MLGLLLKYPHTAGKVLDVGSYNVNGTYRPIFGSGYSYQGLDISPGPNVDIVANNLYRWPVEDNFYDLVISGQCLEHVEAPWLWIDEVYRVCKPGGSHRHLSSMGFRRTQASCRLLENFS